MVLEKKDRNKQTNKQRRKDRRVLKKARVEGRKKEGKKENKADNRKQKIGAKFALCLITYHVMKKDGLMAVFLRAFLTSSSGQLHVPDVLPAMKEPPVSFV
jgi:hypothetical protein